MNIDHQTSSRRQIYAIGVLCVLLTLTVHERADIPAFPFPGVPIIKTAEDFDAARNHPIQFQGHSFQLAGRIIRAQTTTRGVTFKAEWLPFPENTYSGPETRSTPEPQPIVPSICIFPELLTTTAGDKAMNSSWLATWQVWKTW